jgi:predicted membrane channel-forming protein YqfA (hemolysin III family)
VDVLQTVVNVMFFITYVVPMIVMIGFLIYLLIVDYDNGHEVKGIDIWIYLFAAICPIMNCGVSLMMLKDLKDERM